MKMNQSYDELDCDVENGAVVGEKKRPMYQCGCGAIWTKYHPCIIQTIAYAMLLCIFEGILYIAITNTINNDHHEMRYQAESYLHNKNKGTMRRQLYVRRHTDPCLTSEYGCCELYSNPHLAHFNGYLGHILKKDPNGINCPSLETMIHRHNDNYLNSHNCLKEENKEELCCNMDVFEDQMHRHLDMGNRTEYREYWNKPKHRIKYMIDYKDTGCPNIHTFVSEYARSYPCYSKYADCNAWIWELGKLILIGGGCIVGVFIVFTLYYIISQALCECIQSFKGNIQSTRKRGMFRCHT
jgi:hypothetical protein